MQGAVGGVDAERWHLRECRRVRADEDRRWSWMKTAMLGVAGVATGIAGTISRGLGAAIGVDLATRSATWTVSIWPRPSASTWATRSATWTASTWPRPSASTWATRSDLEVRELAVQLAQVDADHRAQVDAKKNHMMTRVFCRIFGSRGHPRPRTAKPRASQPPVLWRSAAFGGRGVIERRGLLPV